MARAPAVIAGVAAVVAAADLVDKAVAPVGVAAFAARNRDRLCERVSFRG